MVGEDTVKPWRRYLKVIALTLGVIVLLAILSVTVFEFLNEPVHATILKSPSTLILDNSSVNDSNPIWINITKTSGGWPFLKNDIYNTMGLELENVYENQTGYFIPSSLAGPAPYADRWRFSFVVTSIASSRLENTNTSSNSIKSQQITVRFPDVKTLKDLNPDIVGIQGIESDAYQSWPSTHTWSYYPSAIRTWDMNRSTLYTNVIKEMDEYTNFPLSPFEFYQQQGPNMWRGYTPSSDRQQNVSITEQTAIQYYHGWSGNLSDCGYIYHIDYIMSPGTTQKFDIITNTDWGLYDTSQVILHVNITAPPTPTSMSESELNKYGIIKHSTNYGGWYYIDANNVSIEVS